MKKARSRVMWVLGVIRLLIGELRLAGRRRGAVQDLKRLFNHELADLGLSRQAIRDVVDEMLDAQRASVARGAVASAPFGPSPARDAEKGWQKAA